MNSIQRIRGLPPSDGFSASNGRTPRDEVHRRYLLREMGKLGLRQAAETAFSWWPTLEETALAILDHLGVELTDERNRPLAITAIADALIAFGQAVQEGRQIEECVEAFLKKIVDLAEHLLRWTTYIQEPDGGQRHSWRQFAEPYPVWLERNQALGELHRTQSAFVFDDEMLAARRMLCTATMTPQNFAIAFKENGK
jgi:hypothetical protein